MYNAHARYKMHAVDCFLLGPASYDQSTVVLELRHQLTLHGTGEISEVSLISVWKVHKHGIWDDKKCPYFSKRISQ